MRIPIIAGNWKMNTTVAEAVDLVHQMLERLEGIKGVEIVLCPPAISLYPSYEMLRGGPVHLGAQNIDSHEQGAFTGEISGRMISPICTYVILGHSERRQLFHETDEVVNQKLKAALRFKLNPIVCVGELLDEREGGKTDEVISRQVRGAFDGIEDPKTTVIAYEPVWAIGTGRAATPELAGATVDVIRREFEALYGAEKAADLRVQYGGSVTAANVADFLALDSIDGGLVGGASLKPDEFVEICAIAHRVKVPDEFKA